MIVLELNTAADTALIPVRAEVEEEISRLYVMTIDVLAASAGIDLQTLLQTEVRLACTLGDDQRQFAGVLTAAEFMGRLPRDLFWYRLRVEPKLALLRYTERSRVFGTEKPSTTLIEIIQEVLDSSIGAGLSASYARLDVDRSLYPVLPMILQYSESDLDFLLRRLEGSGIFFYFADGQNSETLVLGDNNVQFPFIGGTTRTLAYRPRGGVMDVGPAVRSLTRQARLTSAGTALRERDYAHPSRMLNVASRQQPVGLGMLERSEQEGYVEAGWGARLADIRLQEVAWRQAGIAGTSDCLQMQSGRVFELANTENEGLDGRQLVVGVRHEAWSSAEGSQYLPIPRPDGPSYVNRFTAIPAATAFRPERLTPRPRIAGFIRATIDGIDTVRSHVDELGCYRVIFHFDTTQRPPGKSSCPIRLLTPFGGPTEGMHFPLRVGTQVMVSFIDGDPDRPIIAGPLYDGVQTSMVTNANRTSNVIRTSSGIVMKMNDGLPS
jgi:type VI secretion system secreted protein VgrG